MNKPNIILKHLLDGGEWQVNDLGKVVMMEDNQLCLLGKDQDEQTVYLKLDLSFQLFVKWCEDTEDDIVAVMSMEYAIRTENMRKPR